MAEGTFLEGAFDYLPTSKNVTKKTMGSDNDKGGQAGNKETVNKDNSTVFKGKLRGSEVELPGVITRKINYTKRDPKETIALRKSFNSKDRKVFLKKLTNNPKYVNKLKSAGLTDNDISRIADGKTPAGWQVHHKLSLDDGGNNKFDNLVFIKNEPFHKVITNTQKVLTGGLKPGETKTLDFPIPEGIIYPPKPSLTVSPN